MKRIKMIVFCIVIGLLSTSAFNPTAEAKTKWKAISKNKVVGVWVNSGTEWNDTYTTIFYKDGTIECYGWRNHDYGTYKVNQNKNKVVATFDDNYMNYPAVDTDLGGTEKIEGYKYKVTFYLKSKNKLYAKYSKEGNHTNANNGTGYIKRSK